MRSLLFGCMLIGQALLLSACNTVHGMGQDIRAAGTAIERAAK